MAISTFRNQDEELNWLNQNIGGTIAPIPREAIPTLRNKEEELKWLNETPTATYPTKEGMDVPTIPSQRLTPPEQRLFPQALPIEEELPSRSAIAAVPPALKRGAAGLVRMIGQTGKALPIGLEEEVFEPMVKKAEEWQQRPEVRPSLEAQTGLRRWWEQGLEAAIPSIGPQIVGGLIGGPKGWVIGGQIAPALFGLSEYQDVMDEAKAKGIPEDKARQFAIASGLIEWGGESLANLLEAKFIGMGGPLKGAFTEPIKKQIRQFMKQPSKEIAKSMIKTYGTEALTEAMQSGGETYMRELAGLPQGATPWEAAGEAIGPSLVMTTFFNIGGHTMERQQRKRYMDALNNSGTPMMERMEAADGIRSGLIEEAKRYKKSDPETADQYETLADQWGNFTRDAISRKESIGLDQTIAEAVEAAPERKPKRAIEFTGPEWGVGELIPEEKPLFPKEEAIMGTRVEPALPVEELGLVTEEEGKPIIEEEKPPAPDIETQLAGMTEEDIDKLFEDIQEQVPPKAETIQPKETPPPAPAPETLKPSLPSEKLRFIGEIKELRGIVEKGEAGKRLPTETGEWTGYGSTYPTFMQQNKWGKDEVLTAIDKGLEGKKLGPNQQEIWNTVKREARGIFKDRIREQKTLRLQAIPTGELEVGDKIKVRDEILSVTEKNDQKIVIQDGQKYELDPYFDTIQGRKIEGGKPAGAVPVEEGTPEPKMVTNVTKTGTPLAAMGREEEEGRVELEKVEAVPVGLTLQDIFRSGRTEITEEELNQLPDVVNGLRTPEEMRDYLATKEITVATQAVTPELSPTEKDQFKLPGMKIGIEPSGKTGELPPTLEGKPLMEAAVKAEQEKLQPGLELGGKVEPGAIKAEEIKPEPTPLPKYGLSKEGSGTYKGWLRGTVLEGPHEGVVGFGRDRGDVESELRKGISEREKAAPPGAETVTATPKEARPAEGRVDLNPVKLSDMFVDRVGVEELDKIKAQKIVAENLGMTRGDLVRTEGFVHKPIDEAMEYAVVKKARVILSEGKAANETFNRLRTLYEKQPLLGSRTSTSIENQAYSTPVHIGFIAQEFAGITKQSSVYEPTAGTGMLLTAANPANVTANEINKDRADILRNQGFNVTENNALDPKVPEKSFDAVVMNPPFESTTPQRVDGFLMKKLEHVIVAKNLKAMKDDGKAAIIIGGHNFKDGKMTYTDKVFLNWLYHHYNVVRNIDIPGKLYHRQGSSYDIRMIVVDGRKAEPQGFAPGTQDAYQKVDNITQLVDNLMEVSHEAGIVGPERVVPVGVGEEGVRGVEETGLQPGRGGISEPARRQGVGTAEAGPGEREGQPAAPTERPAPGGVGIPEREGEPGVYPGGHGPRYGMAEEETGRGEIPGQGVEPGGVEGGIEPGPRGQEPGVEERIQEGARGSNVPGIPGTGNIEEQLAGMTDQDLSNLVDQASQELAERPTPKEALKKAGIEAVEGIGEALKGLEDLFGGGKRLAMGLTFDSETYAKAKPHFEAAWDHARAAGHSLQDMVKYLIDKYGQPIIPYVKEFLREQQRKLTAPPKAPTPKIETDYQVNYEPQSKGEIVDETLVPKHQAEAISDALSGLAQRVGNIDDFVKDKLQFANHGDLYRALSADQIDAIALAIDNIDRGMGMIVGDQTGVGKGRVAASIIKYAQLQGKKPIFFTEKPNLFSDIYRDIKDIGHDINPLIMASQKEKANIIDQNGNLVFPLLPFLKKQRVYREVSANGQDGLGKYDCALVTYSQVNKSGNTQQFVLRALARNNIVILDESHNASGEESTTGGFIKEILDETSGVLYLSATFAKRPETMPLYYKTSMSMANLDMEHLIEAIRSGGVPLQEILSNNLTSLGQYIRREKSFRGIKIYTEVDTKNRVRDERRSDLMTDVLRDIIEFDRHKNDFISSLKGAIDNGAISEVFGVPIEGGVLEGGKTVFSTVTTSNFASVVHNAVRVLLLSMKGQAAAQKAIEALRQGKKPVIALSNTMETFLDDLMKHETVKIGEPFNINFGDILGKYLRSTLRFKVKPPGGGKAATYDIPLQDLSEEIISMYRAIEKKVSAIAADTNLPGSPIDYIKSEIAKAGYKVDEITGRTFVANLEDPKNPTLRIRPEKEKLDKNSIIFGFNSGATDALIINASGAGGISLHSSPKFKDQRQRAFIGVQFELNIDTEVQKMGRVNRKGQVNVPEYVYIMADIPAEIRPAAVHGRKMKSLMANTSANPESELSQKEIPDMLNKYGNKIAEEWLANNLDIVHDLGYSMDGLPNDLMHHLTGKIAVQPVSIQRKFFEEVEDEYKLFIQDLKERDEYDLEVNTIDFKAETLNTKLLTSGKDESNPFGKSTYLEEIKAVSQKRPFHKSKIEDILSERMAGRSAQQYRLDFAKELTDKVSVYLAEKQAEAQAKDVEYDSSEILDQARSIGYELENYVVGDTYEIGEMQGVLIGMKHRGQRGNPIARSKIALEFAVNNALQRYTLPLSRIGRGEDTVSLYHSNQGITGDWDQLIPTQVTENRYMITGNILQGFGDAPRQSQVVRYTTKDGNMKEGILLPRSYDPKQLNQVRITQDEGKQIIRRDIPLMGSIATLTTSPHRLIVPASRVRGGKFFLDQELRNLSVEKDFQKTGNEMRAGFNPENIDRVIDRLYELGETFSVDRSIYDQNIKKATGALKIGEKTVGLEQATQEDLRQLEEKIKQILPEGDQFSFVEKIWINTKDPKYRQSMEEWAKEGKTDVVLPGFIRMAGITHQWNTSALGLVSMVKVATKGFAKEEIEDSAYHEAWHAIRAILTKEQRAIVETKYETREKEAIAFAQFSMGVRKPIPMSVRGVFDKIKEFFISFGNYLKGKGFDSVESIFGKAYEGMLPGQTKEMVATRKKAGIWREGERPRERQEELPAALKVILPRGIHNTESENPNVEKRMSEAYGLDQASAIDKFKGEVFKLAHSFTRHFEHLVPKRFGKVIDILRRFEQIPEFAKKEASDSLKEIVAKLDKPRMNIFSRVLILNDLVKDYESGLYDRTKKLPFGYADIDQIKRDLTKFQGIANANRDIRKALDTRKQIWDELRKELVDKEILPEAVNNDDRYFHHQVLEYMAIKAYYPGLLEQRQYTGLSPQDVRLHRKGWQIAREGSALDFNTNYLESEFEVFSQAVAQIETIKALDRIQAAEDISDQLKAKAKAAGKTANDWRQFIPEGYTTWQPQKGFHFYMANTITDKLLEQVLDPGQFQLYKDTGKIQIPGLGFAEIDTLTLRRALAVGKRKAEWAIPIELQKTMDNFRDFKDEGPIFRMAQSTLSSWKQWILLNPLRVIKYNLNNLSGDTDIALAYNPKIITQYGVQAMRDLYAQLRGQAMSAKTEAELREAFRGGVVGSGITINEIPDISKQGVFKLLTGEKPNLIMKYWNTVKDYTNFRENVLRLAAYRFFKDELAKGNKVYGASKKEEIDQVLNLDERAAKLARELIGDYGNISKSGQWLRKNLIPFYSWIEINAPRYVRLMKNLSHEGKKGQIVGFSAIKASKLGVKMVLLYALVSMWNHLLFPDEEEELGRSGKRQLHLILGRRGDGTIRSLRFQGALSDALGWFGLEDFPEDFKDVMRGKVPWTKKLEEALWAGPERIFQGARPIEKAGMEVATGKALYPEMRKPRPIRDKAEHILRVLNLDLPYKYAVGKPTRGVVKDIESMVTYQTDPGEAAYYDIINQGRDFLKEQGYELPSFAPTKKSNILYYYKQAQRYGDRSAAQKYMDQYIEAGGTKQDLMKSIKKSHPLAIIPSPARKMFMESLDEGDAETLSMAIEWWQKLYGG